MTKKRTTKGPFAVVDIEINCHGRITSIRKPVNELELFQLEGLWDGNRDRTDVDPAGMAAVADKIERRTGVDPRTDQTKKQIRKAPGTCIGDPQRRAKSLEKLKAKYTTINDAVETLHD